MEEFAEVLPVRVRFLLTIAVATPLMLAGCEQPQAEFVSSERTKGLIRQARLPVEEKIENSFGTPQDLVAWLRLPVDYGQIQGTVEGTVPGGATDKSKVAIDSESPAVQSLAELNLTNSSVYWNSGTYANQQFPAAGYSADTNVLTFGVPLPEAPGTGDTFMIVGHNLREGRKLYMRHCMHCHGVSGDGNGPTAEYLNPRPRDYRLGLFKFTSTGSSEKATREDLHRIVKLGIPGTYMPSFMLLDDGETRQIVEYVRWLSMRGEFENSLVSEMEGDYSSENFRQRVKSGENADEIVAQLEEYLAEEFEEAVDFTSTDLAASWSRAEEASSRVVPKTGRLVADAESLKRGRELFMGAKAKCATCHGPRGQGNGSQTEDFQKIPGTEKYFEVVGLHDNWGNPIQPRNLTRGIYRGGRRPVDLYRRIYAGIKGTPMAGYSTSLTNEEIWDLVNYVLSVPFQSQSSGSESSSTQVASHPSLPVDGRN